MRNTVSMTANYPYIRQVEATLKSLLYHNTNLDIYLMNNDIPQDWFQMINQKINPLGSRIIDEKVSPALLDDEHISQSHLNVIAYARFFIPQRIKADLVLYIDSDVIVNDSLDELFNCHFSDNEMLAAVPEVEDDGQFNSGVMVFNNKKLRKIDNLTSKLLKLGHDQQLRNGDQSVINEFFKGQFKTLDDRYNFEIGMDRWAYMQSRKDMQDKLNAVEHPAIVHYANNDKPWNTTSSGRMRKLWWQFAGMDWNKVARHERLLNPNLIPIQPRQYKGNLFTLTGDQGLAHIEQLIKALPDWHFDLAAYTQVGWELFKLLQYPNVRVRPSVLSFSVDELIEESDAYLDINYIGKEKGIVQRFLKTSKPVLTFSTTKIDDLQNYSNYIVFDDKDSEGLTSYLQTLK